MRVLRDIYNLIEKHSKNTYHKVYIKTHGVTL